jgi:murein DD-endopeptidase MepM/ murein hydrolase activator NlpD
MSAAASASEAQPIPQAPPVQQALPLTAPLANTQVMFGFFDRRFPGYNNGLEHLGVDFSASAGTAVAAICDGTVLSNNTTQVDTVSAVVMVEHDCPQPLGRVYGYYGHVLSDLLMGESVSAGSQIGTVREWPGNGHLHLGLSTRLQEDNWGVVRGVTLQELESQGWLNPLNFFAPIQPRQAAPVVAQPAARPPPPARIFVPLKPVGKPPTSAVKLRRVP